MTAFVFSRFTRRGEPATVYLLYAGLFAVFYSMTATLNLLYQATVAGLSPLEMVLVGTVLEATVFLFEIPTGLLSDLRSRRLSVVVGLALIGAGFLLQGLSPHFESIILSQVIWGIGFTFVSGSDEAWLADEIAADRFAHVFLRAQQVELIGTIVGTLAAAGLGLAGLRVPLTVSGVGFLLTSVVMGLTMPERGFVRSEASLSAPFTSMIAGLRQGFSTARRRPVVRTFVTVSLLAGLSSEAFDRLWTVRVVDAFRTPAIPGPEHGDVLLFSGIALVGTTISLLVSELLKRFQPERLAHEQPTGLLVVLTVFQITGVVTLALVGNLWVALTALWLREASLAIAAPVQSAWLARTLDPSSRATTLSLLSQANAIGQVAGGPPLGGLANRLGVPIALTISGLVLTPAIALISRVGKRESRR